MPTEEEFRAVGYTKKAANFPLSQRALEALCAYNGVTVERAPEAWGYAPNAAMRDYWEKKALQGSP